jgi:hypothetical protein
MHIFSILFADFYTMLYSLLKLSLTLRNKVMISVLEYVNLLYYNVITFIILKIPTTFGHDTVIMIFETVV